MLQMKIKTGRRSVVPGDLPSILGARRAYRELGDLVEALITQMDMMAGDCDAEDEDADTGADDAGEIEHLTWARPRYGVNQTRKALNLHEIAAEEIRREHSRDLPSFLAEITGRRVAA